MTSTQKTLHNLWADYLALCENYQNDLPTYEFGFAMIKFVSKMLFDCHPNQRLVMETINAGVIDGWKWSIAEKEGE